MAKQGNFLGEFFKSRKMVGAVAPSSKFLRKKMLKPIDFKNARTIVELGPGTGIFTKGLLEEMHPDCRLFSFELNESFFQILSKTLNDNRLELVNDSAHLLKEHLEKHGINKVDYIVSSLPLAVIPEEIKEKILNACVEVLSEDGKYIQFQYSLNAKKLLATKFSEIKLDFTPVNIPPAFVYNCSV